MSRIGEFLYFAPEVRFADFDHTGLRLPTQLYQRINGFYIVPAIKLARSDPFAAGLLIVCAMDHLGHLMSGATGSEARFKDCCRQIPDLGLDDTPDLFYEDFRCGLVHEGRVKNASEFKQGLGKVAERNQTRLTVDPLALATAFQDVVKKYIDKVYSNPNQQAQLLKRLRRTFKHELND